MCPPCPSQDLEKRREKTSKRDALSAYPLADDWFGAWAEPDLRGEQQRGAARSDLAERLAELDRRKQEHAAQRPGLDY